MNRLHASLITHSLVQHFGGGDAQLEEIRGDFGKGNQAIQGGRTGFVSWLQTIVDSLPKQLSPIRFPQLRDLERQVEVDCLTAASDGLNSARA